VIGDPTEFEAKFRHLYNSYVREYPAVEQKMNIDEELKRYREIGEKLRKLGIVKESVSYLRKALTANPPKSLLVEGANGVLLDIDFGTYPYVTSSNCSVGGMFTGLGVPPHYLKELIGIVKAYQTRVGGGPFPTELTNEIGENLRKIGHEYGVTTGRPRRCGWLDLVMLEYSHSINGFTCFALTKLDILDTFEEILVAVAYKLDGQIIDYKPRRTDWKRVEVVYEKMQGWKTDTSNCRTYNDLPPAARAYVEMIEKRLDVPVRYIGVGKDRKSLIVRGE
jgi:adenylosuccinate synthase